VDWLRQTLAYSGIFEPSHLRAIQAEPIGSGRGLLSTVIRCTLSWSPQASQRPSSVIIKLRSSDRKTARLARLAKLYRHEYLFYRRIQSLADIRSPRLLYGDFAPISHRFVIVLEDLADLDTVSQVIGVSPAQAKSAVRAAAQMHARHWDDFDHPALSGVPDYTGQYRFLAQLGYLFHLTPTFDRFGSLFNPGMRRLAESYGARITDHLIDISGGPNTFTHGDFRADNLFFDQRDADDVVAIDWQNCGIHSGLRDVTYFLSTSVTSHTRRVIEREVVGEYHDCLLGAGVVGYSFDDCWRDYRRVMLSCLIGPVVTCGSLDLNDEPSRRTMEIGLRRTLAAIEDLQAEEFLPGRPRAFSLANITPRLAAGAVRVSGKSGILRRG